MRLETTAYRIANWDDHFENSRSRQIADARWCPIPNRFDGDRISDLIGDGGDAIYGAWCAALLVASRCEPRGQLIRTSGKPHTPKTLSRMTGISVKSFEKMLQLACSVGLMESDGTVTPDCHPPVTDLSQKEGIEGNGRNRKLEGDFDAFWQGVPNKIGKGAARKAYASAIKGGATHDEIVAGLPGYAAYEQRRRGQSEYRPLHPATWLNGERWTDEHGTAKQQASAAFGQLGDERHKELFEEVQQAEPNVAHSAGNIDTQRAMRRLAKQKGWI